MASQIIALPPALFGTLLTLEEDLRFELWKHGLDMPWLSRRVQPKTISISAQVGHFGLGSRIIHREAVLAIAIVMEGARPEAWPRPLSDDRTLAVLESLEAVLCACESLSGHEALRLAQAFAAARELPAIGPEPMTLRYPSTSRLRRLRYQGLTLGRTFAERLAEIDRLVEPYATRIRTADLEQCIATLSSQVELGIRLRLQPGHNGQDSRLALLTANRRESLDGLMQVVANLAETTRRALDRWAPHSAVHDSKPGTIDLAYTLPVLTGDAWNPNHMPWRDEDNPDLGLGAPGRLRSPVPGHSVIDAVKRWLKEFERTCWVGVHPLIWNAIAHVEFTRIAPFHRANRRFARVLFEAMLYGAGWPVLPWQLGFERIHDDYVDALSASLATRSYRPMVELVLRLFDPVLAAGNRMLNVIPAERARLEAAIVEAEFSGNSEREYADALLGQVIVEGFEWGLKNDRELLRRLHAQGFIDRIRTPAGAVYSSRVARELARGG